MPRCMRTTVNIPDALLERAKARCAEEHVTLGEILSDGLRATLFRGPRAKSGRKAVIPTFRGRGLQPGVDLDSHAALRELMESG